MTEATAPAKRHRSTDLIISLAGAVTSFATIGLNWLLTQTVGFDLLSFSIWFIVPAGALIGGMGAASGYYLGARWTHTMPSRRLLLDMLLIGGTSWVSYLWLDYYLLRLDDGTAVHDLISFWQYFVFQAEHTQLAISIGHTQAGTTGELGALGFVREGLQFLGFLAGGAAAYGLLKEHEVCESCRRYAKSTLLLNAASVEQFDQVLDDSELSLPGLVEQAQQALDKRPLAGLDLALNRCPECGTEWIRPALVVPSGKNFERVKLRAYSLEPTLARHVEATARKVVAEAKVVANSQQQ